MDKGMVAGEATMAVADAVVGTKGTAERNESGSVGAFIENTAKAVYNGVAESFNAGMQGKNMGDMASDGMAAMGDTVRRIENGEGTVQDAENIVAGAAMTVVRGRVKTKSNKYTPNREITNNKKTGNPDIDAEAKERAHTQLGYKVSKNTGEVYSKRRTIDKKGNVVKEIDYTNHGRPQNHTNPHQHRRDPNTRKRLPAEPLNDN